MVSKAIPSFVALLHQKSGPSRQPTHAIHLRVACMPSAVQLETIRRAHACPTTLAQRPTADPNALSTPIVLPIKHASPKNAEILVRDRVDSIQVSARTKLIIAYIL